MKKEIGLGLMRITDMEVSDVKELIVCALDNGVNFFDHADIYGQRRSEEKFGLVLKENKELRKKMIIQTKCGICKGYYDLSKEHIIKQVLESIRLLNCDYVDILLLHRPDALVDYNEVNEAFNYLYENGLVKEFGLSNCSSMQISLYNKYLDHKVKYNQVQLSIVHSHLISQGIFFNMNDSEAVDRTDFLIEYSMLNDIKLQAWSPVMASWEDGTFIDNPKYAKLNQELENLAKKYNVEKNAIALAWILRHPANIMPIVGTTSKKHLLEMVKATNIHLTREEWYNLYLASGHKLP